MSYYRIERIGQNTRSVRVATDVGGAVSAALTLVQDSMFGFRELDRHRRCDLRRACRRMAVGLGQMVEEATLGIEAQWTFRQDQNVVFVVTKMHGEYKEPVE